MSRSWLTQEIATRRNLGDVETVAEKITEEIAEGRHERSCLVQHRSV